jgi:trehalose synthase
MTGASLAETIRGDLVRALTGESADYNLVFTTNGIACTTASVIAATQGHRTLDDIGDDDIESIRKAHLLLAMFNAWQPGVFALSAWDLLGVLPLPRREVADLIASGDTRWVHRAAHDLLDVAPDARRSAAGMPRGRALYGSLPAQLAEPGSFARGLRDILAIRSEYGVAVGTQLDVPDVAHPGMLVMVHRLDEGDPQADAPVQVTVLNFTADELTGSVLSHALVARSAVRDVATGEVIGQVDDLQSFPVTLPPYAGLFLILDPEEKPEESSEAAPIAG